MPKDKKKNPNQHGVLAFKWNIEQVLQLPKEYGDEVMRAWFEYSLQILSAEEPLERPKLSNEFLQIIFDSMAQTLEDNHKNFIETHLDSVETGRRGGLASAKAKREKKAMEEQGIVVPPSTPPTPVVPLGTINKVKLDKNKLDKKDLEKIDKKEKAKIQKGYEDTPEAEYEKMFIHTGKGNFKLGEDWYPCNDWGKWAEAQGLTLDQIETQAELFKLYYLNNARRPTMKNWRATWQSWIKREIANNYGKYGR